ncbi:MAG: hypothetical protein PHP69_06325 [Candidatus Omnitrophica bacterium]|jgi:uncharacterized protein YchJ|nr:hypothetical protein [Candidatus Omnitrophota bacterium]
MSELKGKKGFLGKIIGKWIEKLDKKIEEKSKGKPCCCGSSEKDKDKSCCSD